VHETVILAGMALAIALIWLGMKINGPIGGILGFVVGAILTGSLASSAGVDLDAAAACSRYSSFADDC
jgi:hypothetical protein